VNTAPSKNLQPDYLPRPDVPRLQVCARRGSAGGKWMNMVQFQPEGGTYDLRLVRTSAHKLNFEGETIARETKALAAYRR
jgi:hypothetical protein